MVFEKQRKIKERRKKNGTPLNSASLEKHTRTHTEKKKEEEQPQKPR